MGTNPSYGICGTFINIINNKAYFILAILLSKEILVNGSPFTATRSAIFPTSIDPKIESICKKITYLNTKKELKKIINKKIKFLDNFEEDKLLLKKIDEISD